MSKTDISRTDPDAPLVYEIRLQGHLGEEWIDWFDGLTVTLEDTGGTLLKGPVVDQAALHGLLKKVRDLGLPLVSVQRDVPDQKDEASVLRFLGQEPVARPNGRS